MPDYPIVDVTHLKKCKLWRGSLLEHMFLHSGGLPLREVQIKAKALEDCDDRTPAENELLHACYLTLSDPFGTNKYE